MNRLRDDRGITLVEITLGVIVFAILVIIIFSILLNTYFGAKASADINSAQEMTKFIDEWTSAGFQIKQGTGENADKIIAVDSRNNIQATIDQLAFGSGPSFDGSPIYDAIPFTTPMPRYDMSARPVTKVHWNSGDSTLALDIDLSQANRPLAPEEIQIIWFSGLTLDTGRYDIAPSMDLRGTPALKTDQDGDTLHVTVDFKAYHEMLVAAGVPEDLVPPSGKMVDPTTSVFAVVHNQSPSNTAVYGVYGHEFRIVRN